MGFASKELSKLQSQQSKTSYKDQSLRLDPWLSQEFKFPSF